MNKKKSAISSCIPAKVLIDSVDTYLPIFTDIINNSKRSDTFPEELKLAEVTPFFKMADHFDKVNYRPVSLLYMLEKSMRELFWIKSMHTLNTFLVSLLVFAKIRARNILS